MKKEGKLSNVYTLVSNNTIDLQLMLFTLYTSAIYASLGEEEGFRKDITHMPLYVQQIILNITNEYFELEHVKPERIKKCFNAKYDYLVDLFLETIQNKKQCESVMSFFGIILHDDDEESFID